MAGQWKLCRACGAATQVQMNFCPYCGALYEDLDPDRMGEYRNEWKQNLLAAAKRGDYEAIVIGMASNVGDRGNVFQMIEDFCENADPLGCEKEVI